MTATLQPPDYTVSPQLAELEVNYRYGQKPSNLPHIRTSMDSVEMLRSIWSNKIDFIEELVILLLNNSQRLLGFVKVSQGGTTSTTADIKIIMATALKCNAKCIILSHNHPSHSIQPSERDIELTRRVKEAAKLLDMCLLDHVILTSEDYYSFADEGNL